MMRLPLARPAAFVVGLLLVHPPASQAGVVAAAPPRPALTDEQSFDEDVLPIFEQRCFSCHGPEARRAKGGLRMLDADSLLTGGGSGPALVPGDPDASLLIQSVQRLSFDLEMPPDEALPEDEIATLVRWVSEGAEWPEASELDGPTASAEASAPRPAQRPDPFAEVELTSEQVYRFEQDIRPVLVESCGECHGAGAERLRGELSLASRGAMLRGGLSGPAVVPGDPEASLLIQAVRYHNRDLQMPPSAPLSDDVQARLESWVALGAPWPGSDADEPPRAHEDAGVDLEAGRQWWAFQPVVRPALPAAPAGTHPIDAFVNARLDAAGLSPNPPADPRRLLRRATLDLVGLPPDLDTLAAFADSDDPRAYERAVDALLDDDGYGERWARHWLDLVRYAQSNGYERDEEKPGAWRYRDWVIGALNADMPYDRFLAEQLAGDELDEVTDSSRIATGFYRLGLWDAEPDDGRQALFDEYDDVVRTISEGMLGVTLGCARCHDHKFDPFGQQDYYSMVALVRGVQPYAAPVFGPDSPTLAPLALTPEAQRNWERGRDRQVAALEAERQAIVAEAAQASLRQNLAAAPAPVRQAYFTPEVQRDDRQRALLERHPELEQRSSGLGRLLSEEQRQRAARLFLEIQDAERSFEGDIDWALVVSEAGPEPPRTQILNRGLASLPGASVDPRFVRVLCADESASLPPPVELAPGASSSGRRRALAEWITSEDHPLTARVMVNRVWQHHFGRGLVDTPNDFGANGSAPSHPLLLDWLAAEFMHSGWSLKHLHRLIMTSQAYRRASTATGPGTEVDPGNALLWRQNLRRLEAEAIRDSVLTVSGSLNREAGGRGFFPELGWQAMASAARPGEGWRFDPPDQLDRRSIYSFVKRGQPVPLFEALDYSNNTAPVGRRMTTTIVSQAFELLNGAFMNRQAGALAERVAQEAGDDRRARVERLFERVLSRRASAHEVQAGVARLARLAADFGALTPVLSFQQNVPARVEETFLAELRGPDILRGPRDGWRTLRGPWGMPYNQTHELDRARGPATLVRDVRATDLSLRARLSLDAPSEFGSLLLRVQQHGQVFTGVEVLLDPGASAVRLLLHHSTSPDVVEDAAPLVLAEARVELLPETWLTLDVRAAGPRVVVSLQGVDEPLLDVSDERLLGEGAVGLRTWGGTLALSELTVTRAGGTSSVSIPAIDAEQRALETLALTLLNLNEFVYVD